jgi:hypothetical protein
MRNAINLSRIALFAICNIFAVGSSVSQELVAQCRMIVDDQEVWNSKCCVKAVVDPSVMIASLTAEGWQACLYRKRHAEQSNLPTSQQKCFGPWINIDQEGGGNSYSAYWSLENACHGGNLFPAKRNGNIYQGDNFIFEWTPMQGR